MGAYEDLWIRTGISFRKIAELFRSRLEPTVPSDFVQLKIAQARAKETKAILANAKVDRFGVRVHGMLEYPERLRDADHPVEFLYFQGWWDLAFTRSVAVVGTREATREGKNRTAKLVRNLVADNFTVISGLARGIDTVAHKTAIDSGGKTVAVIGTPLSHSYPSENSDLQKLIAEKFLLISQVPVIRYSNQHPPQNRFFFPERNVTMSALSEATIIVEAGESSGALTQARAAIKQKRKLFVLESCFRNKSLTWPATFKRMGAIRVADYGDIRRNLAPTIE